MKCAIVILGLVLPCLVNYSASKDAAGETVSKHGRLSVVGTHLVDKNGEQVQLKGMSLFWDVWRPQFYNKASIIGIHNLCHSNVVRAAIAAYTEYDGGYVETPKESLNRLYAVVDAAIEEDIYVIVDWHDYAADTRLNYSLEFFDIVSKKYSGVPNLIYEPFNEPTKQSWNDIIKPYHEAVIKVIRGNDPQSIIVLGTKTWSQGVDQAAAYPVKGSNIMYTLHFYAATHKQWLRDTATNAMKSGLALFVTEYGTVNATGDVPMDPDESRLWWNWLDQHNISYANWAISNKAEAASALLPNTTSAEVCQKEFLTESGRLVVAQNKA